MTGAVLALAALAAIVPWSFVASEPSCVPVGPTAVCAGYDSGWGTRAYAVASTEGGAFAEVSYTEQPAFIGNVLVVLAWVHHPGVGGTYGGLGASDYGSDGFYEHACACGAVYAYGLLYVPWGVGHYDDDYDNEIEPEGLYVQPLMP